jgi:tripartite-type tricarboxylate transporter receptor subunit TctC
MKTFTRCIFAALALCLCAAASAQKFPDKPIHLIVPFPPGGTADMLPRLLAPKASAILGVPIVVENRTGAGGTVAAGYVARAEPDGYTLLVEPVGFFFSDQIYKISYDPMRFMGITILASYPSVLLGSPKLPVKDVRELLALARDKAGKLTYASPGAGTNQHLSAEMLKATANVDIMHIPYRGGASAVTDLISGTVDIMFDSLIPATPFIQSGKVKLLAVGSAKRNPAYPDTPTIGEVLPGYESETWMSVVAPPGTPPAIVARLNAAFAQAVADPANQQRIRSWQAEPVGNTPEQMAAVVKRDVARWTKVIRAINLQPE